MTRKLLLIVEDDAWTRYALAAIVRRRGWDVLAASTVEGGMALLDEDPDCVILDLGLPDGRGEAVLRKVRDEGRRCGVLVCTLISDSQTHANLMALRPDAVFIKPVDVEELLAAFPPVDGRA